MNYKRHFHAYLSYFLIFQTPRIVSEISFSESLSEKKKITPHNISLIIRYVLQLIMYIMKNIVMSKATHDRSAI